MLRLHMLSGSLFPAPGGDAQAMDASLWSRLDLIWRVLGFLPAAARFRMHSVSRKWRDELTSPRFRIRKGLQRAVACVAPCLDPYDYARFNNAKVVEVELSAFVPSWFWNSHKQGCFFSYTHYQVVAAGGGMVCISNETSCACDKERVAPTRHCVLNPVTHTCVMLPAAPASFRPHPPNALGPSGVMLSASAVTVYRWQQPDGDVRFDWELKLKQATYDVSAAAGGGGGGTGTGTGRSQARRACAAAGTPSGWTVLSPVVVRWEAPMGIPPPVTAQCGGETFLYHAGRVHVMALPPGTTTSRGRRRHRMLEAVAVVDGPSVALLGLDATAVGYEGEGFIGNLVFLVAHRGAVFLVAQLMRRDPDGRGGRNTPHPELVAGVWRLARRPTMACEPVSRLDLAQVKRVLENRPPGSPRGRRRGALDADDVVGVAAVSGAFAARDLLCCDVVTSCDRELRCPWTGFVVGLDVDAGEWELLVDDEYMVAHEFPTVCEDIDRHKCAPLLELRPDLFLSHSALRSTSSKTSSNSSCSSPVGLLLLRLAWQNKHGVASQRNNKYYKDFNKR